MKGPLDAIRIVAALPPPFHLRLLGDGPAHDECSRLAIALGCADRVTLEQPAFIRLDNVTLESEPPPIFEPIHVPFAIRDVGSAMATGIRAGHIHIPVSVQIRHGRAVGIVKPVGKKMLYEDRILRGRSRRDA